MDRLEIRGNAQRTPGWVALLERRGVVPQHPGAALGQLPVIPSPPLLPLQNKSEHPWILLKAYRGAVSAWTGKACYVLGRTDPTKSQKWARLLHAGAKILAEHGITPARWAYWSLLCWCHERTDGSVPPLHYVWSAKRISKQRGWFRQACPQLGGEAIMPECLPELITMWAAARSVVSGVADTSSLEDIGKSVNAVCSMDAYRATVELAKQQSASKHRQMCTKVSSGAWIWAITRRNRLESVSKEKQP